MNSHSYKINLETSHIDLSEYNLSSQKRYELFVKLGLISAPQPIVPDDAINRRRAMINNGYELARLETQSKKPVDSNWQNGVSETLLLNPNNKNLNTGIICKNVIAIDLDIDDPNIMQVVEDLIRSHLEGRSGKLIVRTRASSFRKAYIVAVDTEHKKSTIEIEHPFGQPHKPYKIEFMGAKQQLHVDGPHVIGESLIYENDVTPWNTNQSELVLLNQADISSLIDQLDTRVGSKKTNQQPPSARDFERDKFNGPMVTAHNKDLGAGLQDGCWFNSLTPLQMSEVVRAMLDGLDNSVNDPREKWFKVLFAVADAARLGCSDSRALALEWSRKGASWDNERNFEVTWSSYKLGKITIGTLIHMADEAGVDLSPWRGNANKNKNSLSELAQNTKTNQINTVSIPTLYSSIPGGFYDELNAMDLMNERYVIVQNGGETLIYTCTQSGERVCIPEKDAILRLKNVSVAITSTENQKSKNIFGWWLANPDRQQALTSVFKPEGNLNQFEINEWHGFGVERVEGTNKCRKLLRHIWKIICRSDKAKFKYLICWLAWAVQNPDEAPGVAVVLKSSREGSGKSTLSEAMVKIFGRHGMIAQDSEHLLAKHNDHLEFTCFIAAEEAMYAGSPEKADKIKTLLTANNITVEPKFRSVRAVKNRIHLMLTTNHDWAVPAGNGARRWFVTDVSDEVVGNQQWFDGIYSDLDNGGYGQFLNLLLRLKLGSWHPRAVPKTQELYEQQLMSADSVHQWLLHRAEIDDCKMEEFNNNTDPNIPTSNLYNNYIDYLLGKNQRPKNIGEFGKLLTQIFGPSRKASHGNTRKSGYELPHGDALREKVYKHLNIQIDNH